MVKKKKNKLLIGIIITVLSLILILIAYNLSDGFGFKPLVISDVQTFTPIFCNDYEFTCCNEKVDSRITQVSISDEIAWQCPLTSHLCTFGSIYGIFFPIEPYIGSENCYLDKSILGNRWVCSDEIASSRKILYPGEYVWVMNTVLKRFNVVATINDIIITIPRLDFCGRAGCTVGVPVAGADQCTFHPNLNTVYESTSSLTGKVSTISYTVPIESCVLAFQSGDRHICGYKEEACNWDADCTGHTYGNVECYARTKQTYGCRSYGTPISEHDRGPFDTGWGSDSSQTSLNTFGKRCEIIKAEQVQCCGDTDCGTNFFCDVSDFTCKESVECTEDYQCGVSVQCDFSTKTLKTPVCRAGKCAFDEVSVDCCNDQQCPSGYFCNVNKECEKRVVIKKQCPFECCEDEDLYFDRLCPDDKPYCIDGACLVEPLPLTYCEDCDAFAKSLILGKIFKSQECRKKIFQNSLFCIFAILKLFAVPFIFILSLIFGVQILNKLLKGQYAWLVWTLSVIFSFLVAWLTYILFWLGVILLVIYIVFRIVINFIPGLNVIRRRR